MTNTISKVITADMAIAFGKRCGHHSWACNTGGRREEPLGCWVKWKLRSGRSIHSQRAAFLLLFRFPFGIPTSDHSSSKSSNEEIRLLLLRSCFPAFPSCYIAATLLLLLENSLSFLLLAVALRCITLTNWYSHPCHPNFRLSLEGIVINDFSGHRSVQEKGKKNSKLRNVTKHLKKNYRNKKKRKKNADLEIILSIRRRVRSISEI